MALRCHRHDRVGGVVEAEPRRLAMVVEEARSTKAKEEVVAHSRMVEVEVEEHVKMVAAEEQELLGLVFRLVEVAAVLEAVLSVRY